MRLDKERQQRIEPLRMEKAKEQLKKLGFEIVFESDNQIRFYFENCLVCFFPYSGWHTRRSIKDGRGLNNL